MVDWRKLSKNKQAIKSLNPIEIYDRCDRSSIAGPLRETQKHVLSDWYDNHYSDRDVIVKMHTGEGKTLVGLLMLQSKINKTSLPCVYVCPNKYLVEQVCDDAKKFGVTVCRIGTDRELPDEFISGKKILVTHVQKMFNGLSKFGIESGKYEPIDTVLLDDSHTCVESIRSASTIILEKSGPVTSKIYNDLVELFKDDLIDQGEGSFANIMDGDASAFMVVPYWVWHDKKSKVIKLLNENKNDDSIKFAWPLIKDSISDCMCCISSSKAEISLYEPSVSPFLSFSNANQRILMSATTQDDSYSIKWLDFDSKAVCSPISNAVQKWYGEKMILIPSLINREFDENSIRSYVISTSKSANYGTLVIVPSKKMSLMYDSESVMTSENIIRKVSDFKEAKTGILVAVNRYDGIDLPDDSCRILLMDSLPFSDSLSDRYEEKCRLNSKVINKRMSQKIEQGLGRGVRGEKDYCVIILIGSRLVRFLKSSSTKSLFSAQTQKQIEIGIELAGEMSNDSESHNFNDIVKIIDSCLKRDEGWKQYYQETMESVEDDSPSQELIGIFESERDIEKLHASRNSKAMEKLEYFIDKNVDTDSEKGWYLQTLARYHYVAGNKTKSVELQQSAFEKNHSLLRPDTIKYKKMGKVHEARNQKIIEYICTFDSIEDFKLQFNEFCDSLAFNEETDTFERSICEIGKLLGFGSERPEKEYGRGPDNLWQVSTNRYFVFECKSGVNKERQAIYKKEAEQMDHSCEWFKTEYSSDIAEYYLIHPTKILDEHAVLNKDVMIICPKGLSSLRTNVKNFVNELCTYNPHNLTTNTIHKMLEAHDLNPDSFRRLYSEKPNSPK